MAMAGATLRFLRMPGQSKGNNGGGTGVEDSRGDGKRDVQERRENGSSASRSSKTAPPYIVVLPPFLSTWRAVGKGLEVVLGERRQAVALGAVE
jgi:hypothetical protein